jgi:hypothetical protein
VWNDALYVDSQPFIQCLQFCLVSCTYHVDGEILYFLYCRVKLNYFVFCNYLINGEVLFLFNVLFSQTKRCFVLGGSFTKGVGGLLKIASISFQIMTKIEARLPSSIKITNKNFHENLCGESSIVAFTQTCEI